MFHYTKLVALARDKHFSLLGKFDKLQKNVANSSQYFINIFSSSFE
jgi:hypothetical protein